MKLTLVPFLLVSLGAVSAAPLSVYVLEPARHDIADGKIVPPPVEGPGVLPFLRVGLAATDATDEQDVPIDVGTWTSAHPEEHEQEVTRPGRHRHACDQRGLRAKLIMLFNWLRARVGLPPVAALHHPHHCHRHHRHHRHHHHHHHCHHGPHHPHPSPPPHHPTPTPSPPPHHPTPTPSPPSHPQDPLPPHKEPVEPGSQYEIIQSENGTWVVVNASSSDGRRSMHYLRPHSFVGRLHKALMTLGPWEGRAMAFVIGCGIGSLMRMVYVLVVVTYRAACSARRGGEGDAVNSAVFDEIYYVAEDEQPVPKELPPSYVDQNDVQVAQGKN